MAANAARADDDDDDPGLTALILDAYRCGYAACEASHPQAGASMWLAAAYTMAAVMVGAIVAAVAMTMGPGVCP